MTLWRITIAGLLLVGLATTKVLPAHAAAEAVSDPLGPYRGHPILSLSIDAPENENQETLQELIGLEPGFLLSDEALGAAIKRIYALGRFSAVNVYAERQKGVVALRFHLRPLLRLSHIEIAGLDHGDDEAMRKALKLQDGDEIDGRTPARIEGAALEYLKSIGFHEAKLGIMRTEGHEPGTRGFRLRIVEGVPTRITSIVFLGVERRLQGVLRNLIHISVGDILTTERLVQSRKILEKAYLDHGFLRAAVAPAKVNIQDKTAVVTFSVTQGPRTKIDIVGNASIPTASLWALWPAQNRPMKRGDLSAFADRIKRLYRNQGYANVEVQTRALSPNGGETVQIFVQIEEGFPIEVVSLHFDGAKALTPTVLQEQVQARLQQELGPPPLIQTLRQSDAALMFRDAPMRPVPRRARIEVPAKSRFVASIYAQVLDEIAAIYHGLGYLDARVGPAQVRIEKQRFAHVVVPVREGQQTFVESLTFHNNREFQSGALLDVVRDATSQLANAAPLLPGQPASYGAVEEGRIALIKHYRDQGYLYARVFADMKVANDSWASVAYRFEEGPQVHVQSLLVRGNRYTRTSLIRKRISLQPGDVYRLEQALADRRAIADLGVFSKVRVKLIDEEQPAELKDVVAEVKERPRQPIEIAPGISTADGPRLRASYSHINVLGTASTFSLSAKLNRQIFFGLMGVHAKQMRARYDKFEGGEEFSKALERELRIGIRSPPIIGLPLSPTVRFDLVNTRENAFAYSLDEGSAIVGIDARFADVLTMAFEPVFSLTNLDCPANNNCRNELGIGRRTRIDQGLRFMMSAGPELSIDLRDNPLNPRKGLFMSAKSSYAFGRAFQGASPGPFAFTKTEANVTGYIPVNQVVFAISGRGGVIRNIDQTRAAPIDQRFFLGGSTTLRGFIESSLIPEDACVLNFTPEQQTCAETFTIDPDNPVPPVSNGGTTFVLLKVEARLPIASNVSFDLFSDFGNLWAATPRLAELANLRIGVGAGLRYETPVGALIVDLGFNPKRRVYTPSFEPSTYLHFSVGTF